MKKRMNKKNGVMVSMCAICFTLASGMLAGCSAADDISSGVQAQTQFEAENPDAQAEAQRDIPVITDTENGRTNAEQNWNLEKQGAFLAEQVKVDDQVASDDESKSVIDLISRLSGNDFADAVVYDPNEQKPLPDNKVMLLFQSEKNNMGIYGYKSAEYGARGIIVASDGKYSYFDFCWSDVRGGMGFYEQDFDHDGMTETAFCFPGGSGSGVNIYRLVMFDDREGTGVPAAAEFTPKMQLEQFESKLQFEVDREAKELRILKNDVTETTINWERFGDVAEGNRLGIDCLNQIAFEINGDRIKMRAGIGILMNQGDATLFLDADEGGELSFDVMYSDGIYEIN